MNKDKIDKALREFTNALPEAPAWVILIKRDGELLSKVGEFSHIYRTRLDDNEVTQLTHQLGLYQQDTLDSLQHGNLQYGIHCGANGVYIIVNLIDGYWLGISYQRVGVKSFDTVIEGIFMHFQRILDAIYL